MHGAIRTRLEDLLNPGERTNDSGVTAHLAQCGDCTSELAAMREQSAMLRSLKGPAPERVELPANFYAGVMRLIEENRKTSVWSALIYSPFGNRLVYASLAVAVLVSSFLVSAERRDGHLTAATLVARNAHYDAPVVGNLDEQRSAVLTNFASH